MEMAVEQTKTRVRSEARASTMHTLLRDCRHAVRLIRHNPIYVVTSILLISASIGLTCTAFAVFDALVLRKLPVPEPDQLVMVSGAIKTGRIPLTRSMFDALSRDRQGITQIFGFLGMGISGRTDGGASIFAVEEVVGDFFTAQGAVPELGRLFGQADRDMVAVISDKAWRTQFGADPSVLSRSITIGRAKIPIVGVTSPRFRGTEPYVDIDAFLPAGTVPDLRGAAVGSAMPLEVVVRLEQSVTPQNYLTHLQSIWPELLDPKMTPERRASQPQVDPFNRGLSYILQRQPGIRRATTMTLLLAAMIFAAACLTLALLAIARAAKQQRQIAIMLAIGGSRWQVLRPYFIESVAIACLGWGGGMLITLWWNQLAAGFLPSSATINWHVSLDPRSAGVAAAMSAMMVVIAGLLTTLLTIRTSVSDVLHLANPIASPNVRLRTLVLAAQLTISVVLLHYGLVYVGDLRALTRIDLGFDPKNLHTYALTGKLPSRPVSMDYFQNLLAQVAAIPGVESAGLTSNDVPLSPATLQERSQPIVTDDGQRAKAGTVCVFPGYFNVLKLPLLSGRDVLWSDGPVAVVTESLSKTLYSNSSPIDHTIQRTNGAPLEIVGVVGNITFNGQKLGAAPIMFIPCREQAQPWPSSYTVTILARSKRGLADVGKAVQTFVDAAGVHEIFSQSDEETIIASSLQLEWMLATISGIFGTLIVILTALGLYAFCNYVFASRTRELAIRAGLGASPAAMASGVLREIIVILASGSIAGLAMTLGSQRFLASLIVNGKNLDIHQMALVIGITVTTTIAAVIVPTARAVRMDIAKALRME